MEGTVKPHYNPLLKPRDIPVLEYTHLQGIEAEGRLNVFFSQVESCTQDFEGKKNVIGRVDALLALYFTNQPQ